MVNACLNGVSPSNGHIGEMKMCSFSTQYGNESWAVLLDIQMVPELFLKPLE